MMKKSMTFSIVRLTLGSPGGRQRDMRYLIIRDEWYNQAQ